MGDGVGGAVADDERGEALEEAPLVLAAQTVRRAHHRKRRLLDVRHRRVRARAGDNNAAADDERVDEVCGRRVAVESVGAHNLAPRLPRAHQALAVRERRQPLVGVRLGEKE